MSRTALVKTNTATAIDLENYSTVTGLSIASEEPTGTAARFVLSLDNGNWQAYDTTNTTWADVATQTLTADSVLTEGNTKAELLALTATQLDRFAGHVVNIAVAMSKSDTTNNIPSITSIKFNGQSNDMLTKKTVEGPEISLTDLNADVEIMDIHVDKEEVAGGTVTVLAATKDKDGNWADYVDYTDLLTSPATMAKAIKFKAVLTSPTPGTSSATIRSVTIKHRTDNVAVFSEGVGVCLTKTYNFINPISRAHLMVKHPLVPDTEITAQIALRESPNTVTGEVLGTGTGAVQTATLAHTENLASHNFALYFDGVQQSAANYSYSPTDGQVTFTAAAGVSVTADYIYGWTDEVFVDMTHDTEYPDKDDNNLVDDQFDYVAGENDPRGSVGTVRVTLTQKTGTVTGEVLGTGTGVQQGFKLAHHAKAETITVLPAEATWKFKDNTDVLLVTAPQGAAISVSYDWAARTNYLESIACIFNE